MSKANDRQEGGSHYGALSSDTKVQHWDLSRIFNWDPMQYQITKYVMRWKDKHPTFAERLVDLKKARHFLDKYIEDAEAYDRAHVRLPAEQVRVLPRAQGAVDKEWQDQQNAAVRFESDGYMKDGTRYQCKQCRVVVLAHSPLGADSVHTYVHCEIAQQQKRLAREALQVPSQSANGAAAPTPSTHQINGS